MLPSRDTVKKVVRAILERKYGLPQAYVQGLGRELVAGVAVELLLIGQRLSCAVMETSRHSPQTNLDLVGQVAALLSARGVSRLKAVGRASVTG